MSMEHKAYIFDTEGFNEDLKEVVTKSVKKNNLKPLFKFIDDHVEDCVSPYTEEELDDDWRDELEEAYDELLSIYDEALEDSKGILFTF